MEINRKALISLFIIGILALGIGWGTRSLFTDTETSSGNTFTAGTLDLKVDGKDDPNVVYITLSNMKPGDDTLYYKWILRNAGTLPGKLSITFSTIVNNENGVNEPEQIAENSLYINHRGELVPAGDPVNGELGQYLKTGVHPDDIPENVRKYVTIIARNDQEGWWVGEVSAEVDIGGSIGWGPAGWTVPSKVYNLYDTGPQHPWGTPGLNGLSGRTFDQGWPLYLPVLSPGEEIAFFLRVKLDDNLQIWNGVRWVEVDDNIIQSDSVTFSITFRLEQVT